jgi:hypothetical protein
MVQDKNEELQNSHAQKNQKIIELEKALGECDKIIRIFRKELKDKDSKINKLKGKEFITQVSTNSILSITENTEEARYYKEETV